jgi:hypothetical protein
VNGSNQEAMNSKALNRSMLAALIILFGWGNWIGPHLKRLAFYDLYNKTTDILIKTGTREIGGDRFHDDTEDVEFPVVWKKPTGKIVRAKDCRWQHLGGTALHTCGVFLAAVAVGIVRPWYWSVGRAAWLFQSAAVGVMIWLGITFVLWTR